MLKLFIKEAGFDFACLIINAVFKEIVSIFGYKCSTAVDFPVYLAPRIETILLFLNEFIIGSIALL